MKKLMMTIFVLGLAGGAYAAEVRAGALGYMPDGPLGGMVPSGKYSPGFADLAVHAAAIKTRDAAPEASPLSAAQTPA